MEVCNGYRGLDRTRLHDRCGCRAVLVDDAVMLDPSRMTYEEAERLYYSIGMPDVAVLYARLADVQAENDEYQEQVVKMVDSGEYDKQVALVEHLQEHIRVASIKLDTLYSFIDDNPKPNRKALLAAVLDITLEPDSEPA